MAEDGTGECTHARAVAGTPRRRPTSAAAATRFVTATVVLAPAAVVTMMLGAPFAISAIASTAAIVVHNPHRYHARPQRILLCYAAGFAISVPISIGAAWMGAPALLAAAASAIIIVASRPGWLHPPTACIPLAVTTPLLAPAALLERWLAFGILAIACLMVLWLATMRPWAEAMSHDDSMVCGSTR
jgi:hypothetical protein